ncbi:hypothetical protein FSP39_010774 [Pinctada imbricata]|uniref:Uncharacterized protein n=1 Tax=Pinctada imbricata TaxID=66713 RepID=A0AA89C5Q7_PINIB|nr:hypothetical protein FSP39_010774 [Pinctada imbricata]
MLVSGIVIRFFADNEYVNSAESEMKTLIKNAMTTASIGDTSTVENFSLSESLEGLGIALIVLGVFFLTISIFGFLGGCCKIKIMLIVLDDAVKQQLKDKSLKKYTGLGGINLESLTWNGVMMQFKCCGVDGYQDFKTYSPDWEHTGIQIYGSGTYNIDMPLACCKTLSSSAAPACAQASSDENYKTKVGCCYDR